MIRCILFYRIPSNLKPKQEIKDEPENHIEQNATDNIHAHNYDMLKQPIQPKTVENVYAPFKGRSQADHDRIHRVGQLASHQLYATTPSHLRNQIYGNSADSYGFDRAKISETASSVPTNAKLCINPFSAGNSRGHLLAKMAQNGSAKKTL